MGKGTREVKREYNIKDIFGSIPAENEDTKKAVESIHRYNPKYIFLAETSSIAAGYVLKEALKKAYPYEPLPKFYRIDPRQVMEVLEAGGIHIQNSIYDKRKDINFFKSKKGELEEFFKKRIKDKNAPILIYDQNWCIGWSPGSIVSLLKYPEKYGLDMSIKCAQVKMNDASWKGYPQDSMRKDAAKRLQIGSSDILPESTLEYALHRAEKFTKKSCTLANGWEGYNFRGRIRSRSNDYWKEPKVDKLDRLREYKQVGREIGEKIHQEEQKEQEKKKKLEQIVSSAVAIMGFSGSLFFIGSSITGNAIGSLGRGLGSLIGVILLFVGIAGAVWHFRGRKKSR